MNCSNSREQSDSTRSLLNRWKNLDLVSKHQPLATNAQRPQSGIVHDYRRNKRLRVSGNIRPYGETLHIRGPFGGGLALKPEPLPNARLAEIVVWNSSDFSS